MASPIEAIFRRAFIEGRGPDTLLICAEKTYEGDRAWLAVALTDDVQIDSYRVDFLVELHGCGYRLAIECDGHDFHDRTKQQAAYDRSRDRDLLAQRVLTIRFTGSEIVHSPERCAADAWRIVGVLNDILLADDITRERGMEAGARAMATKRFGRDGRNQPLFPDVGAAEEHW